LLVTNVVSDTATLCFQLYGKDANVVPGYRIEVTEGFRRAFVGKDSNGAGPDSTDRVDSSGQILGQPTVGTRIQVVMNTIPASVSSIDWPASVARFIPSGDLNGAFSNLSLVSGSTTYVPSAAGEAPIGYAWATYEYFSTNQAGLSDTILETFQISPLLRISITNQSDTGNVKIAASLTGATTNALEVWTTCVASQPQTIYGQPRFITVYQSNTGKPGFARTPETNDYKSQTFGWYGSFGPCVCYLMYNYVTADVGITMPAGSFNWDTGISVSNTSDDLAVFGSLGAPRQTGLVTYYLYDSNYGYVGAPVSSPLPVGFGKSYITLATEILKAIATIPGYTAPTPAIFPYVSNGGFHGYMIVKANFQYCHGYAFVANKDFNVIAQGYVASVIPDPAVKGKRSASAAADVVTKLAAGESLNN